MSDELEAARARADSTLGVHQRLQAEIDRLRAERDALRAENAELRAERDEMQDNYESLEAWCKPLEGLLDATRADLRSLRAAVARWATAYNHETMKGHAEAVDALVALVPDDYRGLAPREEGKQQ